MGHLTGGKYFIHMARNATGINTCKTWNCIHSILEVILCWSVENVNIEGAALGLANMVLYCIRYWKNSEVVLIKGTPDLGLKNEMWGVWIDDLRENR